jgi:hypothetical protein
VGTMECADAEMHDADADRLAVVARALDVGREVCEGVGSEAHERS